MIQAREKIKMLCTSEITYRYNNYGVSAMQGITSICHLLIQKARLVESLGK